MTFTFSNLKLISEVRSECELSRENVHLLL
jgi:hypothetical protein